MLSRILATIRGLTRGGRRPLPPAGPLRDYWVRVKVRLEPGIVASDGSPLVGYFRIFGVRATPTNVVSLIASRVTDGMIEEQKIEPIDVRLMRSKVAQLLFQEFGEGVWHASGQVLFKRWGQ
jgi:hypothetical protein